MSLLFLWRDRPRFCHASNMATLRSCMRSSTFLKLFDCCAACLRKRRQQNARQIYCSYRAKVRIIRATSLSSVGPALLFPCTLLLGPHRLEGLPKELPASTSRHHVPINARIRLAGVSRCCMQVAQRLRSTLQLLARNSGSVEYACSAGS